MTIPYKIVVCRNDDEDEAFLKNRTEFCIRIGMSTNVVISKKL